MQAMHKDLSIYLVGSPPLPPLLPSLCAGRVRAQRSMRPAICWTPSRAWVCAKRCVSCEPLLTPTRCYAKSLRETKECHLTRLTPPPLLPAALRLRFARLIGLECTTLQLAVGAKANDRDGVSRPFGAWPFLLLCFVFFLSLSLSLSLS